MGMFIFASRLERERNEDVRNVFSVAFLIDSVDRKISPDKHRHTHIHVQG